MKKHYFLYSGTILSIIAVAIFSLSNAGGPPAGYTGSPADGKTCGSNGGCHTGNAVLAETGWITSDIPSSGYVPGTTYSITATATQAGVTKFGFQLSPQDAAGTALGTLVATAATQLKGNDKYIEHVSSSTSGTDTKSWTFDWVAPASGTGDVTFYAAFNATNNSGTNSGDQIHTSTLTVQEASVGITEKSILNELQIFPNPNNGKFNVQSPASAGEGLLSVYNALGEMIFTAQVENNLQAFPVDISMQGKGIYYVRIIRGKEFISKTVIVR